MLTADRCDVFISYRRNRGTHLARRLYDALVAPGYTAFLDVLHMKSGPYPDTLRKRIEESLVVLVVVTTDCTKPRDDGTPPAFFWEEIRYALKQGKKIIPILDAGVEMPEAPQWPADIACISLFHAHELSNQYFDNSITRLVDLLKDISVHPRASATSGAGAIGPSTVKPADDHSRGNIQALPFVSRTTGSMVLVELDFRVRGAGVARRWLEHHHSDRICGADKWSFPIDYFQAEVEPALRNLLTS